MNALIILAHPKNNSLNHALAQEVKRTLEELKCGFYFHDLYQENFNPILSAQELLRKASFDNKVTQFVQEIQNSEILIFIHPDWWGQPPAILKGWIDRVLQPGIAYEYEGTEFGKKHPIGLFQDKKMLVLCTSNQLESEERPVIRTVWEQAIFQFCGVGAGICLVLMDVYNSTYEQRNNWFVRVRETIKKICV